MSADTHDLTHQEPRPEADDDNDSIATADKLTGDKPADEKLTGDETNEQIAKKLSAIIDNALERLEPLLFLINEALDRAKIDKEDDTLNEEELVKRVRPLIEQATNILRECQGAIKALDPDGTISNNATRKTAYKEATKEEEHLAESLAKLSGEVTKAIENARAVIKDMPNVKKDLGPLLDLLADPLFQIVSGIGMLLNGVLTLVANILDGLGLGGVFRNLISGLGLEKILKGMGLTGLFPDEKTKKKKEKEKEKERR